MNTKERLIEFLAHLGIGQLKFEENVGLSRGFVNKVGDSIRVANLDKISAAYPELNTAWLLTGVGEMLKGGIKKDGVIRYWTDVDATGSNALLFDDTLTDKIIDMRIPEFKDCTDAVNLYGDSMSPRYKSGQIIILKEWKEPFIDFGNVFLVITKRGHRAVKYLRKAGNSNEVLCVSENPAYDSFTVKLDDILKLYLVKGSIEKTVL